MSQEKQTAKPDALRDIYRDAVKEDRGPSAETSAAILAHARQQAQALGQKARQAEKPLVPAQPAANDRHWLRHALGGLAALGLVGWLMLQHAAWWDGSDSGIGAGPAGDAASMDHSEIRHSDAPAAEPTEPSAAEASAVPADAAADSAAAPVAPAPSTHQSKPKAAPPVAPAQAESSAPSGSRAAESANSAAREQEPAAKSGQQHLPMAPAKDRAKEAADQNKAELPLCPPESEIQDVKPGDAENATGAAADKALRCRPRKPQQTQNQPAQGATQKRVPDAD